jgi:hypothetical protein
MAVYTENRTKPINKIRGRNAKEIFNVKVGGTHRKHCALNS